MQFFGFGSKLRQAHHVSKFKIYCGTGEEQDAKPCETGASLQIPVFYFVIKPDDIGW